MKSRPLAILSTSKYACLALIMLALTNSPVLAWGSVGHKMINEIAARSLPATLPAFLHTPDAIAELTALGPEPDRSKGSGRSWDADYDPGHFLDVDDNGMIVPSMPLNALPPSRQAFDTALRASDSNQYKTGFLPYSILDGYEQVRRDFAYWRVDNYLTAHAKSPSDRLLFARDRALWQMLALRDIGVWGHFVGDASQPLHVTVHFNGWGNYPNPNGYSTSHEVHSQFESAFVNAHAKAAAVTAVLPAMHIHTSAELLAQPELLKQISTYLQASASTVPRLYDIEKAGGFAQGTPQAVSFVDARLAFGASELRNLTVQAWFDSTSDTVAYPEIKVEDILDGKVTPTARAFGD
ncbi:MAG: S1/P1 Nuclease [Candidatus Eremiobacteraeota bacterium]|nr:S1/P1 Nuclease [Candidatus Eremiobacteraeota bacterium]